MREIDQERGTGGNHAFYLSIPPAFFSTVCQQLERCGLTQAEGDAWRRVVIEKPFGHDLQSARELNAIVESVFPPDSVFRIDHYLGKETVQNILALRFANQLFDPIWNAHYVDHVQITMAEDIGIGGRAGYYDGIGAARDVIQNHLLQLLALTAMEEPVSFSPDDLREEKIKVLSATTLAEPIDETTARCRTSTPASAKRFSAPSMNNVSRSTVGYPIEIGVRVSRARRAPVTSRSAGTLAEEMSGLSPVRPMTPTISPSRRSGKLMP